MNSIAGYYIQRYEDYKWYDWSIRPYDGEREALKDLKYLVSSYDDASIDVMFRVIKREVIIKDEYVAGSTFLDREELNQRDQLVEYQWEHDGSPPNDMITSNFNDPLPSSSKIPGVPLN